MNIKSEYIKLFPLGITVLPLDVIPLHIFEDRYKKMVHECINEKTEFGMVFKSNKNSFENIGCSVSIKKIHKQYKDGRYEIIVKGQKRFKILSSKKIDDLWNSEISFIDENYNEVDKNYFSRVHDKYLKLLISMNKKNNFQSELEKNISYDFTKNVLLPNQIKQNLIKLKDETKRLEYIDVLLDELLNSIEKNNSASFEIN